MNRSFRPESAISDLIRKSSCVVNIRHPSAPTRCREFADELLYGETSATMNDLQQMEEIACNRRGAVRPNHAGQLAIKLALSRKSLTALPFPVDVSVVCPAYGENIRAMPRGTGIDEHPLGEDFVSEKARQLEWLFRGTPHDYRIAYVDDLSEATPERSGDVIARVIRQNQIPNSGVLFLEHGIRREQHGDELIAKALRGHAIPKNGKKAGAALYGMAKALVGHRERSAAGIRHVVVSTDCDLAADLGQLGRVVSSVALGEDHVATGSRRLPNSVTDAPPDRAARGDVRWFLREILFNGRLPRDTQCGAKAFSEPILKHLLNVGVEQRGFAYEVELLAKAACATGRPATSVPLAWFHSIELSTVDKSVRFNNMRDQAEIASRIPGVRHPAFESCMELSRLLSSNERVWNIFETELLRHPSFLRGVSDLDVLVLPDLHRLANAAERDTRDMPEYVYSSPEVADDRMLTLPASKFGVVA